MRVAGVRIEVGATLNDVARNTAHLLFLVALSLTLASTSAASWELTFEDDFTGSRLDPEKWRIFDYWGNQTLAGNGELQCYVPEALRVENGLLTIVAEPKASRQDACHGAATNLQYISGMISTADCNPWESCTRVGFAQQYGYFVMRARLPAGKGLWPAFWLVPADASWPPEIDVMEVLGHEPDTVHMNLHFLDETGERGRHGTHFTGKDTSTEFHEFAVDWSPGLLIWYVDGVERFRVTGDDVPHEPMYVIVNLAVGGHWPGSPDRRTAFPAKMEVDYVRVYRRTGETPPDQLPNSSGR